jgi:hypothetical protein
VPKLDPPLPPEGRVLGATCAWWPYRFLLTSHDAEVLRWVRSHLDRTFTMTQPGLESSNLRVVVAKDTATVDRYVAALRAARTTRIPGFTGVEWEHGEADGCQIWHRSGRDGRQVVARLDVGRWLVAADQLESAALTTVRMCRELHRAALADRRAHPVHAALAVDAHLGGLLFVGAPGAGKTTLALALAQRAGYVVSTDQTALLDDGNGGVLGAGSPDTNRVGPGTSHRLAPGSLAVPPLRTATTATHLRVTSDKRWLTSLETEVLFGVPTAPWAPVRAVVVVRSVHGSDAPAATWAPLDAMAPALRREYRAVDPLTPTYWLTAPGVAAPVPAGADEMLALVGRVALVDLAWDPAAHSAAAVREALRALSARPGKAGHAID